MDNLYLQSLQILKDKQQRIKDGKLNCIPFNLGKFNKELPGIEKEQLVIITANSKVGKCFAKGTKIILLDGNTKNVEDITENDILLGPDSSPRHPTGITSGEEEMFTISTKHNKNIMTVNKSHILHLCKYYPQNHSIYKGVTTSKRESRFELVNITVKDYLQLSNNQKSFYKLVNSDAVEYKQSLEKTIKIDAYFYGLWLGDGDSVQPCFTNVDSEIIEYLNTFANHNNLKIKKYGDIRYRLLDNIKIIAENLTTHTKLETNSIIELSKLIDIKSEYISRAITSNKLYKNWKFTRTPKETFYSIFNTEFKNTKKHISSNYLLNTIENRYKLLAGLIDSDGFKIKNKNQYEISSKYESLIEDILILTKSLGLKSYSFKKFNKTYNTFYYYIVFTGNNCKNIPIKINRKKPNLTKISRQNTISFTIKSIGIDNYYGFAVDKDNLFLLDNFTIVHNTQICDFLYLFTPLEYTFENPDKCKVKIFYFTLEMSKEKKMQQYMCYKLFTKTNSKIHIDLKSINSVFEDSPIDDEILDLLSSEEYLKEAEHFEKTVQFFDDKSTRNPTGIFLAIKNHLENNGKWTQKEKTYENILGEMETKLIKDTYIPNDPEMYNIVIVDHLSLLSTESGQKDTRDAMIKFSSEYALELRDKYKCTVVMVQQQAAAQESVENKKADMLLPSMNGLGDAKLTARDANLILGLFSPYRFEMSKYRGFDITYWENNIRFLTIIANREGGSGMCPLFFDGATNTFEKIISHPDAAIKEFEEKINRVRDERYIIKDNILTNRLFFLPTKTKEKYTQSIFKKIKYKIKKLWQKF